MQNSIMLTFDVEEFDLPLEYGHTLSWAEQIEISASGLKAIFHMLERIGIPATFFTTARYAKERPADLILMADGHELASHGYSHSSFELQDLKKSRLVLQEASGVDVRGFRMPRFAPVDETSIADAGYTYNSSINPTFLPGRYNHFRSQRLPYRAEATPELLNIPISTSRVLRIPLFWLGFRHFPLWLLRRIALQCLNQDHCLVLVFHPWEFASINSFELPWYITRGSGQPLIDRLEGFVSWLINYGTATTMGDFADMSGDDF